MLYLTRYSKELQAPIWCACVSRRARTIYVDQWNDYNEEGDLCVIKVGETDACVLALKGHMMFAITQLVRKPVFSFDGTAYVSDIDSVIEWVKRIRW